MESTMQAAKRDYSQKIEYTCARIEHIGHHSRIPLPWEQMLIRFDWGGYQVEWWGDRAERAVRELGLQEGEWVKIVRAWINVYPHANTPGESYRTLRNVTITRVA